MEYVPKNIGKTLYSGMTPLPGLEQLKDRWKRREGCGRAGHSGLVQYGRGGEGGPSTNLEPEGGGKVEWTRPVHSLIIAAAFQKL